MSPINGRAWQRERAGSELTGGSREAEGVNCEEAEPSWEALARGSMWWEEIWEVSERTSQAAARTSEVLARTSGVSAPTFGVWALTFGVSAQDSAR